MPVYELDLENVGPFDDIHFEFDPHLNVFVGPNNCGKSTVQMALGDLTVYGFSFPEKLIGYHRKAKFKVLKGATTTAEKKIYKGELPIVHPSHYWHKKKFDTWNASLKEIGYSCFIPAIRWNTDYRAEGAITDKRRKDEDRTRMLHRLDLREESGDLAKRKGLFETSASAVRDVELIQKIVDLDYKGYREKKPAIRELIEKIATIASEITNGFPIEFVGVAEDKGGLYPEFKTPDGKLPINVLSQGTQSIIQWLGLLLIGYAQYYGFPKNLEKKTGVVIIDEIDAHMHPSWQRRILPALLHHFPNLQIFCSSHSPFVLAGLKAGQAQLLKRDKKGKVVVTRNEADIIGWSMDEILRNFLDITNPTDLQTDESIERLQELRGKRKLTPKQKNELKDLRVTVSQQLQTGPVARDVQRFSELIKKDFIEIPLAKAKKISKRTTTVRNQKARTKNKGK